MHRNPLNPSPWVSMWSHPRSTLRTLLHENPRYGVFYLTLIYALDNLFYFANWSSFGLSFPFSHLLIALLLLSPLVGLIWLYFTSALLFLTGKWLHGRSSFQGIVASLAWSKIPLSISLFMWFLLLVFHPDTVFILTPGPTTVFINFIGVIVGIWALVLLVQALQEVQGFSVGRSLANLFLAWLLSTLLSFLIFNLFNYIRLI